ncbi:D-cysteine desulfhydrase family protein [Rhodobacteraceae bacterium NNCM2]|nr:D-cysteine desulfhydrase family protein [Coraliihabitans acroporae]
MSLGCLDDLPAATLSPTPTLLEPLDRLSAANTGARIWAKRDDTQPLAFGGNKVRQLAFYFGAAEAMGADTVLITGAVQSNYCRLAAAYAAKLGMECHIQHEARVSNTSEAYHHSGNVLLDRMLGATIHQYPHGEDEAGADRRLDELAEGLRRDGKVPYVIHLGAGHPPLGALGYVVCAREVLSQLAERSITIDHIAIPSGSGATHAGFLFGMRALGSTIPVTGYCVRRDAKQQKPRIEARCAEIAELLGIENPVTPEDVVVNDRFLKPGYGQINYPTERAIRMAARNEALILDPVYSGKCMAGALNIAGNLREDQNVLFIHTGGTPAIFAYSAALEQVIA